MGQLIPVVTLDKPAEGARCNQCGYCCIQEVCQLGRELGDEAVCRALEQLEGGAYRCGLVHDPYRYLTSERLRTWRHIDNLKPGERHGETALRESYRQLLGVGRGCDAQDPA